MDLISPNDLQHKMQTSYPLIFIHGIISLTKDSSCIDDVAEEQTLEQLHHHCKTKIVEDGTCHISKDIDLSDLAYASLRNKLVGDFTGFDIKEQTPSVNMQLEDEDCRFKSIYKNFVRCYSLPSYHQLDWPISDLGEIRLFVPLQEGKNQVLIFSSTTKELIKEIHVIYKPMQNKRYVRPVYIVCRGSDGSFDAPANDDNTVDSALRKISFNARILQTFMAENLNSHGFGKNTFKLAEDKEGNVQVDVFHSELEIEKSQNMTGDELYRFFKEELLNSSLYDPWCKFWVFMSCTHYKPPLKDEDFDKNKITKYISGHTALGGGNMALFGTGCLHTWAKDLAELTAKFNDERIIDSKQLFDDSCGRGYYWANYATTLGAAMHELGHTFNLPHTPSGIMGRGFDDMNCFFTCQTGTKDATAVSKLDRTTMLSPYRDKGAHWHRSSAVSLKYCEWIGDRKNNIAIELTLPVMSTNHESRGPVGGGCSVNHDSTKFNSKSWLNNENLHFGGLRIKAGKYIVAIQFIGRRQGEDSCPIEILSPWYGNEEADEKLYEFAFDFNDEKLVSIDIRAGDWVDAVRIHSSYKSSTWIGGNGGCLYTLKSFDDQQIIEGLFGSAATFVTSLGVHLSSTTSTEDRETNNCLYFFAEHGVRNIEAQSNVDEIIQNWEFIEDVPENCVKVAKEKLLMEGKTRSIAIYDDAGQRSTFHIDNF